MAVTTDSRERPEWASRVFASDLDPGIAVAVHLLLDHGIETYESCQGGEGHHGGAGEWPAIRFYGERSEGFKALSVAQMYGLPVHALNRVWRIDDGEPTGPNWELVFRPSAYAIQDQAAPPTTAGGEVCGDD